MKTKTNIMTSPKISLVASATLISCLLTHRSAGGAIGQNGCACDIAANPKRIRLTKAGADALIQVATTFDVAAAKEILGPDSEDLIASEDPVQDKNRAAEFAAKAKEKTSVEIDKKNPNRAILLVGNDDFPLPIPMVKPKASGLLIPR